MALDFVVNVNNLTQGVSEQGFGLTLVFDNERDIEYTILTAAADLSEVDISLGEEELEDTQIYKLVNKVFMQSPSPKEVAIFGKSEGGIEDLNTLNNVGNNDWFILMCTDNSDDMVKKLAEWATANDRIYYSTTQNKELLEMLEYKNAMVGYHETLDDFLSEGLGAYMSVQPPGSATAKFKTIQGSLPSKISEDELKALHKNNGFSYKRHLGINYVTNSKTTGGEYLDIVLGSYYIKFRIQEALFRLATNTRKIGYDTPGISSIAAEARAVLNTAADMGIILVEDESPQYTLVAKSRKEMLPNQVANRDYDGIRVTAQVAGAIESGVINIDLVI